MPFDQFKNAVIAAVNSAAPSKRPAFAMVLGSGFSYPLVPTASGMLRDIPWWLYTKEQNKTFVEYPLGDVAVNAHAAALWKKVQSETGVHIDFGDTGLPINLGDNVGNAYRAIMSQAATSGLFNQELQCAYLRDVVRRIGKKINFAHLFLGAILQAQHSSAWKHKKLFCCTILTTNFDALLQRSLQLHGQLYFMSDQPDVYVEDPTDDHEAVHLFYTHGSIHRPFVANSDSALQDICGRNANVYRSYFEQHSVIVMGYGGWDDSIMKALQLCSRFSGNLYWCDVYSPNQAVTSLRKEVRDLLSRHRQDAVYVPIPLPGGADFALQELHKGLGLGAYPFVLRDPLAGLIDSIESVTIPDKLPELISDEGVKFEDAIAPSPLKTQIIARLKEFRTQLNGILAADISPILIAVKYLMTRALSKALNGEILSAQKIWSAVAERVEALPEQKAMALFNRGNTKYQSGDTTGAVADYTLVIDMTDTLSEQKSKALVNRGLVKVMTGDTTGGVADYTAVIDMTDTPVDQKAMALAHRGFAKDQIGDTTGAVTDCTAVINMADAPTEQIARAMINRGRVKGKLGDTMGSIADFTAIIDMADVQSRWKAWALFCRGQVYGRTGDMMGAVTDYTAFIEMAEAPIEQKAQALTNRGLLKRQMGDTTGAIADFSAVIDMADVPAVLKLLALMNRWLAKDQSGDITGAIADCTAIIDMANATAEDKAVALVNRGFMKGQAGDTTGAIADCTVVIDMADVPAKQKAGAFLNRGFVKGQSGDITGAIADYTVVIGMAEAPVGSKAQSLIYRGFAKYKSGDTTGAIADYTVVIGMADASAEVKEKARKLLDMLNDGDGGAGVEARV